MEETTNLTQTIGLSESYDGYFTSIFPVKMVKFRYSMIKKLIEDCQSS